MAAWTRWSPLTGIAFVGLWIAAFLVIGNDVDTHDSDSKILAYYAKSGNQDKHIAAFFMSWPPVSSSSGSWPSSANGSPAPRAAPGS
jgi:hypothetical protein